jgi:hypothetical protein
LFENHGYDRLVRALQQRAITSLEPDSKPPSLYTQKESASPESTTDEPAVGVRVGTKTHSSDGFTVHALLTNYTDRPVKLDRLELEWWHSDPSHGVRSKAIELKRPLAVNAVDDVVKIALSDGEAAQGESKYSDLRELYAVLHASISVYYYSKTILRVTKTEPFKVL